MSKIQIECQLVLLTLGCSTTPSEHAYTVNHIRRLRTGCLCPMYMYSAQTEILIPRMLPIPNTNDDVPDSDSGPGVT